MAGTKSGGANAAATNKRRYGDDYYKKIGAKGGSVSTFKGFAMNRKKASAAGRKGGAISRRPSKKVF